MESGMSITSSFLLSNSVEYLSAAFCTAHANSWSGILRKPNHDVNRPENLTLLSSEWKDCCLYVERYENYNLLQSDVFSKII